MIRTVYEEMKAWAFDGDALGGYAQTNAAIAKVVADPDSGYADVDRSNNTFTKAPAARPIG